MGNTCKDMRSGDELSQAHEPVKDDAFPPYPLTAPSSETRPDVPRSWFRSRRLRRQRRKHMTQAEREPNGRLRPDLTADQAQDKPSKGEGTPEQRNPHGLQAKCLLLHDNHYVISGSLGVTAKHQVPKEFLLDTGSAYNVIRASALPQGWEAYVTCSGALPELGDAGGHRIKLTHEVILRVRFGNSLYRVAFLVAEKLSVPTILGTQFANRHVDAIRCIRGVVEFTRDSVPIIGHGSADKPWTSQDARIRQRELLHEEAQKHDDSGVLTRIRLAKSIYIPAFT